MKTKLCKCGETRPVFVFDRKGCDRCRMNKAQKKSKRYIAGWDEIRARRNVLLTQTDYMDYISWRNRKTKNELEVCDAYRNALRDITKSYKKASDVVFPDKPVV